MRLLVTHLDKILKLLQQLLLLQISICQRFFISCLEILPVEGRQVARGAGRAVGAVPSVAVDDAVLGLAWLWGSDLGTAVVAAAVVLGLLFLSLLLLLLLGLWRGRGLGG